MAPLDTLRSFQDALPNAKLVSAYGLTEAGGVSAYGAEDDPLEKRITTSGKPFNGVEIRIINPETGDRQPHDEKGLIEIKGPSVFKGYLNDPVKSIVRNLLKSILLNSECATRTTIKSDSSITSSKLYKVFFLCIHQFCLFLARCIFFQLLNNLIYHFSLNYLKLYQKNPLINSLLYFLSILFAYI